MVPRILSEKASPQIAVSTDFTLNDAERNKEIHSKLWAKVSEVIKEDERNLFYRVGDSYNGWYAGYDKRIGLLYYLVRIKRLNKKLSGTTVTQTLVWRWPGNKLSTDITKNVIFDILLHRYPAIMSDSLQTKDGGQFWKRLLALASDKNYHIGLLNFNTREVIVPKEDEDVAEFIIRVEKDSWGDLGSYSAVRFIISNNPIIPTK